MEYRYYYLITQRIWILDVFFNLSFTFSPERHALLSEKPVKRDQRKAEGTLSANRPSEVERDFAEFFDNERMDAMEMMHNSHGSAESIDIYISYPRLACMIFEVRRIVEM